MSWPAHAVPVAIEARKRRAADRLEDARPLAIAVVRRYGSVRAAGRALDGRFGLRPGSSERALQRFLNGRVQGVRYDWADRLWVMS